jgi:hypothetical protein
MRTIWAVAALLALAPQAAPGQSSGVVIEGCSVFDPESGAMLGGRTIVIRGERIAAVAGPGEAVEIPPGASRVDGRKAFALPGLIDAHVHLVHVLDYAGVTGDEVLPLYLAAGVTSVRSTGDEIVAATLVARIAADHPGTSPRVFTCSPLLDADPPIHRGAGRAVADPAQVPAVLDEVKRWGAATAKIYAGTRREVGRAIIEEGKRRGLFVTAHLGAYSAQDAATDGVEGLEHITSVFDSAIPPEHSGGRGRVDLTNPRCEALIAELARRKVFVDPTLTVFRNMILLPDVPEVRDHPDVALAPGRLRAFWPIYLQRSGCPQGGSLEDRRREFAKYQELVGRLHRAGVTLLVGTDSPEPHVTPGVSLHQEMERLVESGLTPAEVLRAATLNNARALRQEANLGSIAAGKLADLVLLTGNPLEDVRNTRRIELVVRGGLVVRPSEILRSVPRD